MWSEYVVVLLVGAATVAVMPMAVDGYDCSDSSPLGLSSDGLQWEAGSDPLINWMYTEWWFFAVYDQKADIAGAFGYSVRYLSIIVSIFPCLCGALVTLSGLSISLASYCEPHLLSNNCCGPNSVR